MIHAKHLIRALLLVSVCLAGAEVFRQTMKPESFGELGHFRADAISDMMQQSIVYEDKSACATDHCHADVAQTVAGNKHQSIDCQMCHAPLGNHADATQKTADMIVNRSPELCLRCHEFLTARPETIKQIVFSEHTNELGLPDVRSEGLCLDCHASHEPGL